MILRLNDAHIDAMLQLQNQCMRNADLFLPTSREGYLRAFQFDNFCYGWMEGGELLAFLNCSIPTARGSNNLGRGVVPDGELAQVGHMNTLLVKNGFRHHGIGHRLVEASLEAFAQRGCRHIFATASPKNAASLSLLEGMSFSVLGMLTLRGEERCLAYRKLIVHS